MNVDLANIRFELMRRHAALGFELIDDYVRSRNESDSTEQLDQRNDSSLVPNPIGPVRFHIVEQLVDGASRRLIPPLEMRVQQNSTGVYVFSGQVSHPTEDRRLRLAAGTYVVRITSLNYQVVTTDPFDFPAPDPRQAVQQYELEPSYAYPFSKGGSPRGGDRPTLVRGSLHDFGGQPVYRALVEAEFTIPPSVDRTNAGDVLEEQYLTDETGQWVLVVPDNAFAKAKDSPNYKNTDATLHIIYPGEPAVTVHMPDIERWKDNRLGETVLNGHVELQTGIGVSGAVIRVQDQSGSSVTDRNGDWSYYFRFGPA